MLSPQLYLPLSNADDARATCRLRRVTSSSRVPISFLAALLQYRLVAGPNACTVSCSDIHAGLYGPGGNYSRTQAQNFLGE